MSILNELSSSLGIRGNEANKAVAKKCLEHPEYLKDLLPVLCGKDKNIAADAAEVMTEVSNVRPDLVAPYAKYLVQLVHHKNNRTRWEAMHAIANVAHLQKALLQSLLPDLVDIVEKDESVIVRDYAVDAVSGFASCDASTAKEAFPVLLQLLRAQEERHAGRALEGLIRVIALQPGFKKQVAPIAEEFSQNKKATVAKLGKKLLKNCQ
jgi:hypothetical protein